MSEKEILNKMTGTRLTEEEFEFVENYALEKKWTVAQVIREFVRDKKNELEVEATV